MKKAVILFICLLMILLSACQQNPEIEVVKPSENEPAQSETQQTEPSVMPASTPSDSPSPEPTIAPTPDPTPSAEPTDTVEFYSSYAFMVSYDPANGLADFDYFVMLTGEDAVDWLVSEEGYTLADAQARVDDFADSEFILKNTNPLLRTIDLNDVDLKLMFHDDGTMLTGTNPITSDVSDVTALYHLDDTLLFDTFFFYIHVDSSGEVTLVEQVYWP